MSSTKWPDFAGEFNKALNKTGYITTKQGDKMIELTTEERKVVIAAVRASLDLRARYVTLMVEDKKMNRKQARFMKTEIPALKSALKKLRKP